jgi:hypothetical protein
MKIYTFIKINQNNYKQVFDTQNNKQLKLRYEYVGGGEKYDNKISLY